MTKVLSKHFNKMAEGTTKDLLKYQKEPPEDPEKLLPWLLNINEEFFHTGVGQSCKYTFKLVSAIGSLFMSTSELVKA